MRVSLSLAAIDHQVQPLMIGALLSVYALVPMILSVTGGRWIDRIGVRRPLFTGLWLMVFGSVVAAVPLGLPMLFVTSSLVGSGFLISQLVVQKLIGDRGQTHEQRRALFGWLAVGYSISGVLGPVTAGFLYDGLGAGDTFLALALMPLFVLLRLLRGRAQLPGPAEEMPVQRRFVDLLRTPELRRLYLAVALVSSAWDVHQFVVPIYGRSIGLSASEVGLILSAFGIATLIVRLLLPLAGHLLTEWRAIILAQVVAMTIYCLYPFSRDFPTLFALSFALGLGLGVSQPMVLSLLHRVTPPGRIGEAAGLRLMIVNGTQTVLPGAFGALGSLFGVGVLFWTVALVLAGGVLTQQISRYNQRL